VVWRTITAVRRWEKSRVSLIFTHTRQSVFGCWNALHACKYKFEKKRESYDLNAHPWWENNGLGIISCFPFFGTSLVSTYLFGSSVRPDWESNVKNQSRALQKIGAGPYLIIRHTIFSTYYFERKNKRTCWLLLLADRLERSYPGHHFVSGSAGERRKKTIGPKNFLSRRWSDQPIGCAVRHSPITNFLVFWR
jgi:hypothetical protein